MWWVNLTVLPNHRSLVWCEDRCPCTPWSHGRDGGRSGGLIPGHQLVPSLTFLQNHWPWHSVSIKPQHTDLDWSRMCQNRTKGMEGRR